MNRLFRAELGLPIRGNGQRVIRLSQHRHPAQQKTVDMLASCGSRFFIIHPIRYFYSLARTLPLVQQLAFYHIFELGDFSILGRHKGLFFNRSHANQGPRPEPLSENQFCNHRFYKLLQRCDTTLGFGKGSAASALFVRDIYALFIYKYSPTK